MTTMTSSTVRESGEGERRWFCGGGLITWKATAEETGGAFLMFEDHMDEGKVTPLHVHPEVDETFYMLEGEIALYLDGEQRRWHRGDASRRPACLHGHLIAGTAAVSAHTRE